MLFLKNSHLYNYYLFLFFLLFSFPIFSMQNPHESLFYQSKAADIPQIKINIQAQSQIDYQARQGIITNSKVNQQIKLLDEKSRPQVVDAAIKQYNKSIEAYEKILNSKSSVEISQLTQNLRDFEFLFCFEHLDNIFLDSPVDAVTAEERFLSIISDKETIARLGNNTQVLNKIEYYKKQIETAKLIHSICEKSLSSADSNADKKCLIDLWYEAQKDNDLRIRTIRRTHSHFGRKVSDIMKENLRNVNFSNLRQDQLVKLALEMQEMKLTNPTFSSFLDNHSRYNGKFLMLKQNCESILKRRYGEIQLTLLDINQKRFKIRSSHLLYPPANHQQMEIQKEVIIKLGKLSWQRSPDLDDVAHDIAQIAINFSQENKIHEANLAVGFLDEMSSFKDGSFQTLADEASKFKQDIKENWGLHADLIGIGVTLPLVCPPAALVYTGVMMGFGLASSAHEFVKNVQNCYDSVIRGDSFKIGQEFTKLGINSLNLTLLYRSFHHMFKTAKANGQLVQSAEEFNNGVRTLVEVRQIREEVMAASEYSKLMASATSRGMTVETWNAAINNICSTCGNARGALRSMIEMDAIIAESQNFIPRGYGKRINVNIHHDFFADVKGRNISGYHSTAIVNPNNCRNIRFLQEDIVSEGGISIARVKVQIGNSKPKEKTIWLFDSPRDLWNKKKEILDNLDFSKFKVNKNGSFSQNVNLGKKIIVKVYWDPKTSTISTFFPTTEAWIADFGSWEKQR